MVPHETKMFLHIRGHCHSTEETAYRIGKIIISDTSSRGLMFIIFKHSKN